MHLHQKIRLDCCGRASGHCPYTWPIALLTVTVVSAVFRLLWLGQSAFRADTMHFFDLCHRPVSGWMIFTQWMELMGRSGQFPFPLAITKGFVDVFHLPITDFMIRLPMALFGIATIPVAVLAGALLGGKRFGLFFGLLLVLNPFHIQLSRECYFYPPVLLGSIMMLWSALWIFRRRNSAMALPIRWYVTTAAGFFLLTYSHLSGWWLACLIVPFTIGVVIWRLRKGRGRPSEIAVLSAIYLLIGIPLLVLPWAVPHFLYGLMHPEVKANVIRVFGENRLSLWTTISSTGTSMAWGHTVFRAWFTVGVVALTFWVLFLRFRMNRAGIIILMFLIIADVLCYIGGILSALPVAGRYQAFLMPLYLLLLAYGIWHAGSFGRLTRRLNPRLRRGVGWVIAGVAILLCLEPAWASIRLTGMPIPYKEIAHWCDTQLPPRTLVLVERWLDPWNELRVHNSTNVYFTFTVPAEPQDVFEHYHWPETVKPFFNHFPDAAYLEYNRSGRARMGVVSNVYFARQVAFTNVAGIKLAKLGLAFRGDFYDPATNGLIATIFYNTREDVIRHAREQGQTTLVLYAPSWGYVKLWQQLKDFRDWRILEDKATLDIYNLTDRTNSVSILISGMAANGAKRVRFGMLGQADFQNLQLAEWRIEHVPLKPGLNSFMLTDALWPAAKIPLLVDRVEVLTTDGRRRTTDGR